MFLYDAFYSCLLLILYFDSNISHSNSYLLSRAKNPIVISSMKSRVSNRDVYQYNLLKTVGPPRQEPQTLKEDQYFYATTENIRNRESLTRDEQMLKVNTSNQHKMTSTSIQANTTSEDIVTSSYPSYQYDILLQSQNLHSSYPPFNQADYYWRVPAPFDDNLPHNAIEFSRTSTVNKNASKRNEPTQTVPTMQLIIPNIDKNRYEIVDSSAMPSEVYQFSPMGTSSSPENIYKEPIHFSALYLEEPSYRKHSTGQNKLHNFENVITFPELNYSQSPKISSIEITDQFQPPVSSEKSELDQDNIFTPFVNIMYLDNPGTYKVEHLKSVEGIYNVTPLKTSMLFYVTTSSESSLRTRKKFKQFTPLLTSESTNIYSDNISAKVAEKLNKRYDQDVKTSTIVEDLQKLIPHLISKASDSYNRQLTRTFAPVKMQYTKSTRITPDYWNIFWQMETRKNPTETTDVLQLEPATTTKVTEEYWNEFIHPKNIEAIDQHQFNVLRKTIEDNTGPVKDYSEEILNSSVTFRQEQRSSSSELEDHDHVNKRHRIFTTPTTPALPAILKHFGRTDKDKSTSERNRKVYIGYQTLWKPKFTPSRTKPSLVEHTAPTRTSKIFDWNFNDNDASWPKVELVLPTTMKASKSTKSRKTFPTYFPFYFSQKDNYQYLSTPLNIQSTTQIQNVDDTDFLKKFPPISDYDDSSNQSVRQKGKELTNRCFECGLTDKDIPYYPTCFHLFNSANQQARYKTVTMKKKCSQQKGCFKRFVDLGEVYNERGCRELPPKPGKSFASSRLARLESTLKDIEEGCVTSPHASLTPFSRAISLFAKYHACVCKEKYCNSADRINTSVFIVLLNICLSIYMGYYFF